MLVVRYLKVSVLHLPFLCVKKSFEMKVNVSGSEFVALQYVDVEDTDAVILRVSFLYIVFINCEYF